jgi:tRNA (guanine-N7-)-methyltransferase
MRNKQSKFAEVDTFENVVQWNKGNPKKEIKKIFKTNKHRTLELACGKGEYTLGLSKIYPNQIFIGVDIQGERIWRGAKDALEENINNAYFLRTQIGVIERYIPRKSIDEIWITFPDPFLKDRQAKKRLTSPNFLKIYKKILKKGGSINLKTDSPELYQYTLDVIHNLKLKILENIQDIYSKEDIKEELKIQTTFEKKHLENGKKIFYLKFKF